ncbi:DUF3499 family protein [Nocardioides sp. Iso805N]|uniref:DUF3499 domain-containing protein n=1 Tax=Nocardioides sp. Iso805N TaxID=1283287 RepID=UPI0003637EA9
MAVTPARRCSRTACTRPATCTLTYVYADQTAVLGPLSTFAEPHAYDLCEEHAERLSAPRGWEVVRLVREHVPPGPSDDDLLALANAVREAGRPAPSPPPRPAAESGTRETGRRGHLRVLTTD